MPFRSERQRRYLWARRPDIARRWTNEHGSKPTSGDRQEALKRRKRRKR